MSDFERQHRLEALRSQVELLRAHIEFHQHFAAAVVADAELRRIARMDAYKRRRWWQIWRKA